MILSLNVYRHLIITGGRNGLIHIWNLETGIILHTIEVPSKYLNGLSSKNKLETLNTSIYGHLAAFGLSDGCLYIFHLPYETSEISKATSPSHIHSSTSSGNPYESDCSKSIHNIMEVNNNPNCAYGSTLPYHSVYKDCCPQMLWELGHDEIQEHGFTFAPLTLNQSGNCYRQSLCNSNY